MKKYILIFTISFSFSAFADWFQAFTEYRALPKLGMIIISNRSVRGKKYVEAMGNKKNEKTWSNLNIIPDSEKSITRSFAEEMDGKKIVTDIEVTPPAGSGYGGANTLTHIKVSVNSKLKIDCTFGYLASSQELNVTEITLHPEDGLIVINGTYQDGDKELQIELGSSEQFLSDPTVITDAVLLKKLTKK